MKTFDQLFAELSDKVAVGDPASTGLPPGVASVTGTPALPTASAMRAAGRACSPTREPTVTV